MNNQTNELKDKIQNLLTYATNLGERSKNLSRLLYQQLYEVIELERLENLEGKILAAYLLWKSITRANYQAELLKNSPHDREKLLDTIEEEINSIEKRNQQQLSQELTNEELLKELSLRIRKGAILLSEFSTSQLVAELVKRPINQFKEELAKQGVAIILK